MTEKIERNGLKVGGKPIEIAEKELRRFRMEGGVKKTPKIGCAILSLFFVN